MVQHRGFVSIVCGSLILSYTSSILGSLLISLFGREQSSSISTQWKEFFFSLVSIAAQTATIIVASVVWKLRLNDRRPDLLFSLHSSLVYLTTFQIIVLLAVTTTTPYFDTQNSSITGMLERENWNSIIVSLPALFLGLYLIRQVAVIDIVQNRSQMLRASLLFDSLAVCTSMVNFFSKLMLKQDLERTNSPILIWKAQQDTELVFLSNIVLVFCTAKIFYVWIFSDLSGTESNLNPISNVLPLKELESLHFWNLISAFTCLVSYAPCVLLFLAAAVFVGATIRTTVNTNDDPVFFQLSSGQKRGDLSF